MSSVSFSYSIQRRRRLNFILTSQSRTLLMVFYKILMAYYKGFHLKKMFNEGIMTTIKKSTKVRRRLVK